ncbi:polyribonucleotide nucleotidyltransferase [Rickettsiales bacterium]|nr:polyribonucleotide nucleotidyltransferase [Rickettsiales bacterium]
MFNVVKKEIEWGGRTLSLETGRVARQADGAVVISYGETVLLCTAVVKKEAKEGVDFLPLTVTYQEKAFAAGKIPGGFFKREGRPGEKETLVCRLIDRPIRPLFPDGFYNEIQVICTLLSYDNENDSDIAAMIGASAALALSGAPFDGPIAGAKVGYKDGEYLLNPTPEQLEESDLNLVVAGTESSVLMVESEANLLSEDVMLGSVEFGHKQIQPIINLINEFKAEAGKEDWTFDAPDNSALKDSVSKLVEADLRNAYAIKDKQERVNAISNTKQAAADKLQEELGEEFNEQSFGKVFKSLEKDVVRGDIIKTRKRIDGRAENEVRQVESQVDILPRTHGSALFTRGETQALVVTTLGTAQDMQRIDAIEGEYQEGFMLHYNFPPFSVGEASMLRPPGRREIGHGKLAWRALKAVLPNKEEFPYTIRIVSEITESNGSSSMATVCGSSLAMMDAGVPLKAPVSGIAMGLIKEGDDFVVLSDILGDEDHLGDMDFKVAGSEDGITALQMDIKIKGITLEIMKVALEQAKEGRLGIIKRMESGISQARNSVNKNAPQIVKIKVDQEKIGAIIGPGGKVIREICETSGAKIDIDDDGTVNVAAVDGEKAEAAIQMIKDIVCEPEVGVIYDGKIVKIFDFGALVNFLGKTDGLVHISEVNGSRIENINEVVNMGDSVKVKVLGIDRGKVRLSMKRVDQETGEDISDQFEDAQAPQRERKERGGNRGNRGGKNKSQNSENNSNNNQGNEAASNDSDSESSSDDSSRKKRFF